MAVLRVYIALIFHVLVVSYSAGKKEGNGTKKSGIGYVSPRIVSRGLLAIS